MALTTLAAVKAWLGIDNTNSDALLQSLIDACSAAIVRYLDRNIEAADYVEYYSGSGSSSQTLRNYPINSVASVAINGINQTLLAKGVFSGYGVKYFDRRLIGQGLRFAEGLENVQVSYNAGYNPVPDDIEQACNELVALRWKNGRGDRLGVSSKTLANETVSYITSSMTASTKSALDQYKNMVPV